MLPLSATKYTPAAFDTIGYDLLTRVVAIQKLIPIPGTTLFADAGPRFWEPVAGPFPRFYNRLANMAPMGDQRAQAPMVFPDTLMVEMRLIVGPLSSGYLGETEDIFNKMVYSVFNIFRSRPYLDSPTDGTAFTYLMPRQAAQLIAEPGGFHGYSLDVNAPSTLYLGGGFFLTVNLRTTIGRLS